MSSVSYCIPNHGAGMHKVLLVLGKVWSAADPGVEKRPREMEPSRCSGSLPRVGRGAVVSYE